MREQMLAQIQIHQSSQHQAVDLCINIHHLEHGFCQNINVTLAIS